MRYQNNKMSTSNKICNDGASKSNDDGVCEVVDMLHNMSTTDDNKDNEVLLDVCANCGKEANSNDMNTCNKCKMVKYCNAACKKKHRSKHKKKCDRRVAELHDEQLFEQPPPQYEDCPICFLRMPLLSTGRSYQLCCGKMICSGCIHAPVYDNNGNIVTEKSCPFCRLPASPSNEEAIKRINRRVVAGDANAISNLGFYYANGDLGLQQDWEMALELWNRAAELGSTEAYHNIGYACQYGRGVAVDMKKAKHYWELAAIKGQVIARNNLGCMEEMVGNIERAKKHWMIALRDGYTDSLETIQKLHSIGAATKEEYTQALRSYQVYLGEIKSSQRDKAAVFNNDKYKYY